MQPAGPPARQRDKQDERTASGDARAGKSTQKSFLARVRLAKVAPRLSDGPKVTINYV